MAWGMGHGVENGNRKMENGNRKMEIGPGLGRIIMFRHDLQAASCQYPAAIKYKRSINLK